MEHDGVFMWMPQRKLVLQCNLGGSVLEASSASSIMVERCHCGFMDAHRSSRTLWRRGFTGQQWKVLI